MTKTEIDFLRALLRQAEAKKRRVSLAPESLRRLLDAATENANRASVAVTR